MAEAADIQGMHLSPARRWLRRTAAVLAGAPLVAALLAGSSAPQARADAPAKAPTGSSTVTVSLDQITPNAPEKGDTLRISGTLTNKGKETVTDAQVDLRVGPRLYSRTAIDTAAGRTGYLPGTDPYPVGGKYTVEIDKLRSGISQDFTLSVPVSKLGLGDDGVYQLGVSLSGRTSHAVYDQVLGIKRTFLPWQDGERDSRIGLSYLWPLIASAHLTAETGSDEQQTPVFADDDLAAEIAPGGRLEQMVSLGRQLPVTWVIDPDLLASVDAMTKPYRVRSGDTTVAGTNQELAKKWLTSLEAAVSEGKVVALPFGDPDLASIAHRGKTVSGTLSHLQTASEVAGMTVETILHLKPSTDFAWPVDGAVDPSIVDVATSAGAHNVIARSDSLEETGNLAYTPSAARPIGGGTTAVVADARLSTVFQGDMGNAGSSTLAVQKFLALTLALAEQDTDKDRSVVVAPSRMPTVAQAQSMARALHALDDDRWTQPQGLTKASATKPDAEATTSVPPASRYPKKLRRQELPTQAFQDIKSIQSSLDNFQVILTHPERVVTPFGNAVNRSMSTSWRGRPLKAQQYRDSVRTYLQGLVGEVQLVPKSDITLSGRSATIPVTVQNRLLQDVDDLVLRLKSDNATRLKLNDGGSTAEQPIQIGAGHSQSVKFDAAANINGQVQMTAQLYTKDGTPYGEEMAFTVKVSEITPTVLLVIAGGLLLLVLAGIRMYAHRKRANGGGTAGDDGSEPEQPSDPTPDTGPESTEPSGTGEKVDR
ncbi:hypothetical protein K388_03284 [Streptomyces sp. KhCrAH-43]|uniref:DUF6049 family protein n=1 Tax=unclassified Streptomyces TaxID=2593676 RepID=UPI00037143F9|nr:DUF6049 family protein [Streptomyces sp. KhCrAH-43]MYS33943.1 hypothetical protein [Streptomyces sp. SID4920]MYX70278.1 hypothetical protein [Streptomyces sp. SID8373]RAJ60913.1 hypothetical protein K388_03284 [Streptomyces sp. KhCrAH-43]